jgi:transcription termination/antitermination protein NusG
MYMGREDDKWYALFVITGEEDRVKERLHYSFSDHVKIVVPKRKLRERKDGKWRYTIRKLFPGYVLLNGILDINMYYRLKDVPGVIRTLRSDSEFQVIDRSEINVISRLISENETIGISNLLVKDGRIIITKGPLVSLEGRIVDINKRKGRAKVLLSFMGEPRMIELGVSVIQPA